jgi:hypothetical protein
MVGTVGKWGLFTLGAVASSACSQIAGIADYRNGGVDAAGPGAAVGADSDGSSTDGAVPSCSDPDVALVIDVLSTSSPRFTGIVDNNGLFTGVLGVGQTFAQCVPKGTMLDLRVASDDTEGLHDWGACGQMLPRCKITVQTHTVLDVRL